MQTSFPDCCFESFGGRPHSQTEELFQEAEDGMPFINMAVSPRINAEVYYSSDLHFSSISPLRQISESSNECFGQHLNLFETRYREEIEISSDESYLYNLQNQETDLSQGSTTASSGYCCSSPSSMSNENFSFDKARIRSAGGQNKIFSVIRCNKVAKNQESKKRKKTTAKTPQDAKMKQNQMKNYAGLITQRLKTTLTTLPSSKPYLLKMLRRLKINLSQSEKEEFLQFVSEYRKDWKTWKTISKYFETDLKYGQIFKAIILEFLSERSSDDFEDWLCAGKMNDKSKMILRTQKQFFIDGFLSKCPNDNDDEEIIQRASNPSKRLKIY